MNTRSGKKPILSPLSYPTKTKKKQQTKPQTKPTPKPSKIASETNQPELGNTSQPKIEIIEQEEEE
ncbi:MAG: hypothetical protein Q8886_02660, partial [Candidatus Phytoplasma australasiaticum]|nr:hypothetical protein [Candidatus Phytoplasma australasiaticum]